MIIERNKNPAGRVNNIGFGLLEIVDGLVRVASFGFFHTRLLVNYTRNNVRKQIDKLKNS